jgi:hypothetical protein
MSYQPHVVIIVGVASKRRALLRPTKQPLFIRTPISIGKESAICCIDPTRARRGADTAARFDTRGAWFISRANKVNSLAY